MHRVTVTVQRFGDPRTRELEVSDSVPGTRLARMISRALSWDLTTNGEYAVYQIEVLPLGRRLAPDESLASAGAWDGSWLILHAVGTEWQAEPDDDTEPVPTREQVWSTDLDPPTDIGVGQDRPPNVLPAQAPGRPDDAPTRPLPRPGQRGAPQTYLFGVDLDVPEALRPPSPASPLPAPMPPLAPSPPALSRPAPESEPPPTRSAPKAISSPLPPSPAPQAGVTPDDEPAALPPDTPLRGFRPWRSRRKPAAAPPTEPDNSPAERRDASDPPTSVR